MPIAKRLLVEGECHGYYFFCVFSACEPLVRKLGMLFGLRELRYKYAVEEYYRAQNQVKETCILLRRMKQMCFIRLYLTLLLCFMPQDVKS